MNGAELLGAATIAGSLYRVDWYPGVKLGGQGRVKGEVYSVPESMMAALDEYEGHEYTKKRVAIDGCALCAEALVWEYNQDISGLERIPSGDWLDAEPA